jgi:thymidylate synthase
MYQRSCDLGLGVPFNIASYSLLTIMIAHVTGLEPGEFVHVMGDAHVYKDHIEPLKVQLDREPRPFPKMYIRESESTTVTDFKNVDTMLKTLESFEYDSFELSGYDPHDKIVMKMSV